MNPVDEFLSGLLTIMNSTSNGVVAVVIFIILMILTVAIILSPLFIWGIHNQTTKTAKELIKLNRTLESWKSQQLFKERQLETSSIKPPPENKQPEQITRSRKVFHKPSDDLPGQKKKQVR